jgi:hypothetical protein
MDWRFERTVRNQNHPVVLQADGHDFALKNLVLWARMEFFGSA